MFRYLKRRFDRWVARVMLCHKLHVRRDTPDIVLRYLANSIGDQQDKMCAGFLD